MGCVSSASSLRALLPIALCLALSACGNGGDDDGGPTSSPLPGTCGIRVDVAGAAAIRSTANERWQGTDCLASLSEHRSVKIEASELGELRHYQVSGEGSCAEPLEPVLAAGGAVTLGPFAFRAQLTWRD